MAGFENTIYYAGFNGHLKLRDEPGESQFPRLAFYDSLRAGPIPNDVRGFSRVNYPGSRVSLLSTTWSATLFRCNGELWHAGHRPSQDEPVLSKYPLEKGISADDLTYVFGDPLAGIAGAVTASRSLLIKADLGKEGPLLQKHPFGSEGKPMDTDGAAISGDGRLYVACRLKTDSTDRAWLNVTKWDNSRSDDREETIPCPERLQAVAAGSTAVAVVTVGGRVLTTGSRLQSSLLARTPTKEHPADDLGPVDALGGIRIVKVCMCEWLAGAMSVDRDLYIWGGRAGEKVRIEGLPTDGDDVKLVDIAGGVDIADFAVGMGHILVLTAAGEIWGCGENEHGQLGLSEDHSDFVSDWVRIPNVGPGHEIEGVVAGGYGSWLITERSLAA